MTATKVVNEHDERSTAKLGFLLSIWSFPGTMLLMIGEAFGLGLPLVPIGILGVLTPVILARSARKRSMQSTLEFQQELREISLRTYWLAGLQLGLIALFAVLTLLRIAL